LSDAAGRWASQSAISGFGRDLRDAATRRALELELVSGGEPDACLATIGELLPRRIGAAQIALIPLDHADVTDLREFIDVATDLARAAITSAETAEALVDAVGDSLDSLHSFLTAHELVPRNYLNDLAGPSSTARSSRSPEDEGWERLAQEARREDPVRGAAENNLALAA
jgi:hypothetical protein